MADAGRSTIVTSERVMDALVASGILTNAERCNRVVIDLKAGDPVVIHARYFGDGRLLDVIHSLDGVEVRDGSEPAAEKLN